MTSPFARWLAAVCALAFLSVPLQPAEALITGGKGNEPIRDPGWPRGAEPVFNTKHRVAWWEGPPFGGGQWHAECRGDAAAFNALLEAFAKIEVPKRRLVVHDGVGRSFWLDPNRENKSGADIDWVLMVWQPDRWEALRKLPADIRPRDDDEAPVPQIDLYAGGDVRWSDVKIPDGIEVIDRRLEAHGFTLADGTVLQGRVSDLASSAPIRAIVRLERVEPQKTGGYRHETAVTVTADDAGRWVIKSAPAGWHRIVVEAEGYVPRVAGYGIFDDQPRWNEYQTGLSKPAPVRGRVTDNEGKPLAGVQVRLGDVVAEPGGLYEATQEYRFETNEEGRFVAELVPRGSASVRVHKTGYVRPGLGLKIETPADDVSLEMVQAASVKVTVSFTDASRPAGYIVNMEPEGGGGVGKWSGSGNIDEAATIGFENVPPGRYTLTGRPNPGSDEEETTPLTFELKGGETKEVTIIAR